MCGRVTLVNPSAVVDWFDVELPDDLLPRFNVAPTQPIAVVRTLRQLEFLRWGIPREHYARWLESGADVSDLLRPAATSLVATPVSRFVNSPANDDPRCLERSVVEPAQRALF